MRLQNTANRILGYIFRSIKRRSPEVILQLYLPLVIPHSNNAVQFCSPHYRKDIDLLESEQRRMSKKIQEIDKYSVRSEIKGTESAFLRDVGCRGDLIEVFRWYEL